MIEVTTHIIFVVETHRKVSVVAACCISSSTAASTLREALHKSV